MSQKLHCYKLLLHHFHSRWNDGLKTTAFSQKRFQYICCTACSIINQSSTYIGKLKQKCECMWPLLVKLLQRPFLVKLCKHFSLLLAGIYEWVFIWTWWPWRFKSSFDLLFQHISFTRKKSVNWFTV